jgi:branched-chain amino acid transport system permease protein
MAIVLANIAALASLYVLLGTGYVLVYRASRILNLAHGDLMTFCAYGFFTLLLMGGRLVWSVPGALVFAAVVGIAVYVLCMRFLVGYPPFVGVLATIAIGIIVRAAVTVIWTGRTQHPASLIGGEGFSLDASPGGALSLLDGALVAVAIAAYGGLAFMLRRSKLGLQMRAVAEQPLLAAQLGVRIHWVVAVSWGVSTLLAAAAGIFHSTRNFLSPEIWMVGLAAFTAALIGGLDSLAGLVPGAIIVAASEALMMQFGDPTLSLAVPYLLVLVVLWVRPWGLFGSREELERV